MCGDKLAVRGEELCGALSLTDTGGRKWGKMQAAEGGARRSGGRGSGREIRLRVLVGIGDYMKEKEWVISKSGNPWAVFQCLAPYSALSVVVPVALVTAGPFGPPQFTHLVPHFIQLTSCPHPFTSIIRSALGPWKFCINSDINQQTTSQLAPQTCGNLPFTSSTC